MTRIELFISINLKFYILLNLQYLVFNMYILNINLFIYHTLKYIYISCTMTIYSI